MVNVSASSVIMQQFWKTVALFNGWYAQFFQENSRGYVLTVMKLAMVTPGPTNKCAGKRVHGQLVRR